MEIGCVLLEIFLRVLFFLCTLYTSFLFVHARIHSLSQLFRRKVVLNLIPSHRVSKIYRVLLGFLQTLYND